jgi:hypothetical protein
MVPKLEWLVTFLDAVKPETRTSVARIVGIISTATELSQATNLYNEMVPSFATSNFSVHHL